MHAAPIREPRPPHFLRREHQHRSGPADQGVEEGIQHSAIGAALRRIGRVAVKAVLADIEEEGREVFVAEVGQRADVGVEVVVRHGLPQRRVQLGQQRQHVTLQLRHLDHWHLLGIAEPVERAQQVAEGVAQLAVLVRDAFQDLVANAVVLGEIDAERP